MKPPLIHAADPYVIAEVGVNHDGSLDRALELVDAAADAGASAVKFQYFHTDLLMSRASRLAAYQARAGEEDPFSMLRRLELNAEQLAHACFRAHQRGIHAILSVFSVSLVGEANLTNWDAYKSASPDIVNRPLLEALQATEKPLIVSTGAASPDEIERAAGWLRRHEAVFLHCVSAYPTPDAHAALGAIRDVARLTGRPAGYSDHTTGVDTGALAVAAGARVLEKHLTYSCAAKGPDHAASLEPSQMARYIELARRARLLVGDEHKRVLDVERDVREASRQSIVATRNIPRGRQIQPGDLTIKRPGGGIPPFMLHEVIGRVAARDIEHDMPLRHGDLS